jgi:hypothetical protein
LESKDPLLVRAGKKITQPRVPLYYFALLTTAGKRLKLFCKMDNQKWREVIGCTIEMTLLVQPYLLLPDKLVLTGYLVTVSKCCYYFGNVIILIKHDKHHTDVDPLTTVYVD